MRSSIYRIIIIINLIPVVMCIISLLRFKLLLSADKNAFSCKNLGNCHSNFSGSARQMGQVNGATNYHVKHWWHFHCCSILTISQYVVSSPNSGKMPPFRRNFHTHFPEWLLFWSTFHCSVPKVPIDKNPALVYIMAWHRIGDKPISEPMLTRFTDAYTRH